MALTRNFKETIQARIERDPAFREGLLKEGVDCLLSGDIEPGRRFCGIILTPPLASRSLEPPPINLPKA